MGRSARMLTAVLVALVATLLAAAAPASAIKVKVRVETNRSISLIYQGFVDRTLVDLPDGGPPVEVSGGTCASNSPIAALKTALASLPAPLPFAAQVDATQGGKVTQIGTVDTT